MLHAIVAVAGTFDVLHEGHFALLRAAFAAGAHVEIWLADDAMCAAKARACGQALSPWAERAARVSAWADAAGFTGRHSEHALADALGPAARDRGEALAPRAALARALYRGHGAEALAKGLVSVL
jgi:phosphopantetheine adenylyltransferase